MLDREWLRTMMVDESVQIVAETLAKDRHPRAALIEAETRRMLLQMDLRPGLEDLRRRTLDEDEARAMWRLEVEPVILRDIADLRPN